MRRWIARAALFYPREWRERYGEEFHALLDDATADWRQLLNVIRTGLGMQFAAHVGTLKTIAALSMVGALVALAVSYRVPQRYVSSATFRITPVVEASQSAEASARPAPLNVLQREAEDRIDQLRLDLTSRENLLRILHDPDLNLFPTERQEIPFEDLAQMLGDEQSMRIEQVNGQGTTVRISFAYSDPVKAQAVVRLLASEIRDRNDAMNRETAANWAALWSTPIPFSERVESADDAAPRATLIEPRRSIFVAAGIAASLLLGALALFVRRRPRWALRIAACGLLGAFVFAGASLLISERYTSSATLRLSAPFDPAHYYGLAPTLSMGQLSPLLAKEILNPANLLRILSDPKIGADRSGVLRMGMKDRNILEVSVTYSDALKARSMVVEMISELQAKHGAIRMELAKRADEQVRYAYERRAGEMLEMVTQPSSNDIRSTHYRLLLTLAGAALGILFAAIRYRTSRNGESSLAL